MCPAVDGPVVSSGFFQGEESAGHTVGRGDQIIGLLDETGDISYPSEVFDR